MAGVVAHARLRDAHAAHQPRAHRVLREFPSVPHEGQHPSLEKWLGAKAAQGIARIYETPLPQDWVGFATQMHHQASGGASYLWGERRMKGWWYYYFVALAVKVPLGLLAPGGRAVGTRGGEFVTTSRRRCVFLPCLVKERARGGGPGSNPTKSPIELIPRGVPVFS